MPIEIIQKINPLEYKEDIINMWEQHLPGTPAGRFDWISSGNPFGEAIWFLATDTKSRKLIGTTNISPMSMLLNGKKIRTGICGDLMIIPQFRRHGVAQRLIDTMVKNFKDYNFEFIYVIPNQKSYALTQKAGFQTLLKVKTYLRPIKIESYLRFIKIKRIKRYLSTLIEKSINKIADKLDLSTEYTFEINNHFNVAVEQIQRRVSNNKQLLIGEKSPEFFKWRYIDNPHNNFEQLLIYKDNKKTALGYCIYTVIDNRIFIYDMLALSDSYIEMLLKRLIQIAIQNSFTGIYVTMGDRNPINKNIKQFFFLTTQPKGEFRYVGDPKLKKLRLHIFQGDRNL